MKDKTEKQLMVENLVKLLPDNMKLEEVLYAVAFLNNERQRKRNSYKSSGRPPGRPRKVLIPVVNTGE